MTHLTRVARQAAAASWGDLTTESRSRVRLVLLDTLGCARVGSRLGFHRQFAEALTAAGGPPEAAVWFGPQRVPAAHAALINGTVAHHAELDDGNPRASLHGGVTIVPAALAAAEFAGATGRTFLEAIAAGYSAAVACGQPLLDGITTHRLHPPGIVGCFGAAAAAAHALGLTADETSGALSLAGCLLPVAPFESFTKGAPVKDMYAGWPAYIGVTTALMARAGLSGPVGGFEATNDGIGQLLCHAAPTSLTAPDPNEILHTHFKAYATCRSVQPALTAFEQVLPLDVCSVDTIAIATYPFAVDLSRDSDPTTAIGAKTSIPYGIASYLIDGNVGPESFLPAALADEVRRRLAGKVTVEVATDMLAPLIRGARVEVQLTNGMIKSAQVNATRWSKDDPATDEEILVKFWRLAGRRAEGILEAVEELENADGVDGVVGMIGGEGE